MGDEWETPPEFFEGVKSYFGLDIDVCASESNHKLEKYYTIKENGLSKEWKGKCWCNPPYSNQKPWIEKSIESVIKNDAEVFMLIPMSPETKYYNELVLDSNYTFSIYLIKGRLSFLQDKKKIGSPRFASCLIHFRKKKEDGIIFYVCDRKFENIKRVSY